MTVDTFYTFDQIAEFLDDIVDEIPDVLLNGLQGIFLEPQAELNDKIPSDKYFVMGAFIQVPQVGKRIELYYGSIIALYGLVSEQVMKETLRHVLKHELRHHIETLAGCDDLVQDDDAYIQNALAKLEMERNT